MALIQQLSDTLSNKIAAGEVVERPASVVKELVENAIDAKSTSIRVDVKDGGLASIRVLDNGNGIEPDDRETAFLRHATSKIKHDHDLFRIKTLGFRGEALPSIASVSKLTLKTSSDGLSGETLSFEAGKLTERVSSSARKGTEIIVEELFFNTPARLKYVKTIHTELGHITDVMNRMALAHPTIAFTLTHESHTLLETSGKGDLLRVIAAIYGVNMAKKMIPFQAESLDYKVTGFLARPEVTRANRSYMSTVINGRFVKNYAMMRAIQAGYHTLLPIGKYPVVVLHVEMNPLLVDVNVHPSKLEVRLSKEQAMEELIRDAIAARFKEETLIPSMQKEKPKQKVQSEQLAFSFDPAKEREQGKNEVQTEETSWLREQAKESAATYPGESTQASTRVEKSDAEELRDEQRVSSSINEYTKSPVDHTPSNREENETDANSDAYSSDMDKSSDEVASTDTTTSTMPQLHVIGQLHGTYILAENETGFYMIDQHAAQERIKYEFYVEKLAHPTQEVQELLVPLTFDFTQQEASMIAAHIEDLEQVGLFLEPFGKLSYLVRAYPTWFPKGEEEDTILEMLEQLRKLRKINVKELREDAAILMSCKGSIKANHHLEKRDMERLLLDLRLCQSPYTCPHGRPIIVHYSTYEIEKLFKRVMN
ncbi:DNA mismatch repair endonuclease MutL [Paenalkalicoccus suaedae]|uniref:DNA mismatch repair protein MutL n=1 Tax=Paenalkalicoccus suaedae TaxID=2592382 RepID=A0A859FEU2_9BACI|nr:DNA mismatch repair endonuclease MutL [Paenalkalicoccus suaedae]QKS71358.1 DNA mismatch repair endonuclease MutL [Paenalkalicoccus suaedae]